MTKVIINTLDGTVTSLKGCVIVDLADLDNSGRRVYKSWKDSGNDDDACELGETYGEPLSPKCDCPVVIHRQACKAK